MIALDLFAGTGWGVACQRLGIEEYGVEIMPEVVATRTANGMKTAYRDVWLGLEGWGGVGRLGSLFDRYDLLIASPPCQTFSMAGSGAGRKALDNVLGLIDDRAYTRPRHSLRPFSETHDPRTALVLTPLAHVYRDTPTFVVFEQVPPVLPVWERCADEMRRWGYSVWTGILNAEQYGVPQTRRRAILIARADGIEAKPPIPTHSRYHSRDPKRLDPGVLPWVSMADALGWGMTERPYPSIAAGGESGGGPDHMMLGGSGARRLVSQARENGAWAYERPATTVTGDARVWPPGHKVNASDEARLGEAAARAKYGDRRGSNAIRVEPWEAAILQSFPENFEWVGGKTAVAQMVGNAVPPLLAEAILKGFLS